MNYTQRLVSTDSRIQSILAKLKKSVKLGQEQKTLISSLS